MSLPAAVIRVDAARVLEVETEAAHLSRFYSAKGAAARFNSCAILFKLHREGRLSSYRLATCADPRRQPLRFREEDLQRLIVPDGRR